MLSARLIEATRFEAVYLTGFGTAASLLGMPDYGFVSLSEMVESARRITLATSVPLIADADTGYGNALGVYRTVREYEAAGVAAIQLEDQVFPKRCGHMDGKQVVAREDHAEKIRAAFEARRDPALVIIARTDARLPLGLDEALGRLQMYHEAGADVLFLEAPCSLQELEQAARALGRIPLVANMVEGGKTPVVARETLAAMGYKIILYPVAPLFAAVRAMQDVLCALWREGSTSAVREQLITFEEFNDLIGLKDWQQRERRHALGGPDERHGA